LERGGDWGYTRAVRAPPKTPEETVPTLRLRAKLTLALLVLSLLPLAVLTATLTRLNLARLERSAKEYSMAVADQVLLVVQSTVEAARAELAAVGVALTREGSSGEERMQVARAQLLAARFVRSAALYDRRGQVFEALRDESVAAGPPRPEALPQALRERAEAEGVALGAVVWFEGRPHLPLVAVMRRGEQQALYGYLWTALDLAPLAARLQWIQERRSASKVTTRTFLVDESLRLLAGPVDLAPGVAVASRGFAPAGSSDGSLLRSAMAYSGDYEAEGEPRLGVLLPVPDLGWGILVEQRHAEAYAGVRETWQAALVAAALVTLLAALAGLLLGRSLAAPILSVARAAERAADGDFEQRVPVGSRDEVGHMAQAFNSMLSGLREREFIRETFGRYVTAEVVERALAEPESLRLGGDVRQVSVLISDLRGFTSLSEQLGPQAMVALLNRYFTRMAEQVMAHGGTLSEFTGDGIVAFFGAPTQHEDDPVRAVACALAMQQELARFNAAEARSLEMGIGVATGRVIAGNIGSEKRMKYGVVGDTINLAARLESFTVGGQVLICAATAQLAGATLVLGRSLEVQAKGKKEPVRCHAAREVRGAWAVTLPAPPDEGPIVALDLAATLYPVQGKEVATEGQEARAVAMGRHTLTLRDAPPLPPLSNVKLSLRLSAEVLLEDLYAKVIADAAATGAAGSVELCLTSVPQGARERLDALLAAPD